jgi:hypothetical protein
MMEQYVTGIEKKAKAWVQGVIRREREAAQAAIRYMPLGGGMEAAWMRNGLGNN